MALKLSLKPDERVIIGGAVLRNTGGHALLTVENEVPVLRGKHVIGPAAADTPVRQLAFTIQMMYLSGQTEELKRAYLNLLAAIVREAPSMTCRLREISTALAEDRYYRALRQSWDLIEYEKDLIKNATRS